MKYYVVSDDFLNFVKEIVDRRMHEKYCKVDTTGCCSCGLHRVLKGYEDELYKIKRREYQYMI
jgi:hypothetical protein